MSDSTGTTAGGITGAIRVGAALDGASCDTTGPAADFFFSLDGRLEQCGDYPFTNYDGATRPVTVFGFIPSGESFIIDPQSDDAFDWRVIFRAGTQITFYMRDAEGRNGGTSRIISVEESSDDSCLPPPTPTTPSTPASTSQSSSGTGTPSPSGVKGGSTNEDDIKGGGSGGNTSKDSKNEDGPNIGVIVGAAVGGLAFLAIFVFLGIFFVKRNTNPPAPSIHTGKSITDVGTLATFGTAPTVPLPPHEALPSVRPYDVGAGGGMGMGMGTGTGMDSQGAVAGGGLYASYKSSSNPNGNGYGAYQRVPYEASSPNYQTTPDVFSSQQAEFNPYAPAHTAYNSHSSQGSTGAGTAAPTAYGYNQPQSQPNQEPYTHYRQGSHPYSTPAAYQPTYEPSDSSPTRPSHQQQQYSPRQQTSTLSSSVHQSSPRPVVRHRDIDDPGTPEDLPPEYSDRRAPIPGLPNSRIT
ncbi:hypothetical protein CC1G_02178 [Coprinopsis cinerea okayama7|uniref:Uncharacterized protein n=1 Tax=Coprinopsis cinerea (strain Okayama-7 / 130 / ATCC MYA-4618 / FGSC 9003) TaxID=240176 RepID=A8NKG4_COPC7|nr:hypothetical protein CC1G_02178 [Coprinopsis cinerea okayama7\|eukprot:XP_001834442.1 hypothetical protein CC1G_02178 [Coprinopsis cinerea okayama7\